MRFLILAFAVASVASSASAQARDPWFTHSDGIVLGSAAATSAVLIGWDRQISQSIRESSFQRADGVRSVMDLARVAGDPGALLASGGLWLSGRIRHDRTRERVGLRALESVVLAGAITGAVKGIAGRSRPDLTPGAPRNFVLGRGVGDRSEYQAFPSGHSTAAFAFASAIDAELDRIAPDHPRWIVPLLYGMAAATAVSRVYDDRHWASDVVMGSAIGFVGARVVVRFHGDRR